MHILMYSYHFRIGLCHFSGLKIYPAKGKTLVKADGRVSIDRIVR